MARNEAILKQKEWKGFTFLSTDKRKNWDKFSEMKREKEKFLFISLTPRKSDNTIDWKKMLKWLEHEITLLQLDKIEKYIKDKVNPALEEWFKKIPGPGGFPTDPAARLALFNEIVKENADIELPMNALLEMWKELKTKQRAFMGVTYFKLKFEPDDDGVIELNCKHGDS